ncbi:MAG TPA: hypothetical protein VFK86_12630 [Bauldia sp.]|nr:hypothetical protein [Bauldia sp.]
MRGRLIAVIVLIASPASAEVCHRYGAVVTLAGSFEPAVLAESISGHDDSMSVPRRTADLLILDAPLCVASNTMSAGVTAASDVQLLCPDLAANSGEAIVLTGMLVGAHTGNGHTPVILSCTR